MQLNQYYTEELYGDRLVNSLNIQSPNLALDLGFGAGGLLYAARRRWSSISLIGIDVDKKNILNAKRDSLIEALELNGFSADLPEIIGDKYGLIDLLVSNPPYFSKDLDFESKKILRCSGLLECISNRTKNVPAELIFLAQNLRLLSDNGEIGIILPAGLVSGEKWQGLREFLFNEYHISNVIQLPINSFKGTDAQTFILVISKLKSPPSNVVSISHVLKNSNFNISVNDAVSRADFQYYESKRGFKGASELYSGDFSIFRGNRSHKVLKESVDYFIHTTEMPFTPQSTNLMFKPVMGINNVVEGDILIARVGRRCLGRALYVMQGSIPISDCIIAIRPNNKKIGSLIWEKISSSDGVDYLKNTSLGVGAKYVTHHSINEFLINY